MDSWLDLAPGTHFGVANLPYGSYATPDRPARRIGVAIGEYVLDLHAVASSVGIPEAGLLDGPVLNPLLAAGPDRWHALRERLTAWFTDPAHRATVEPHLEPRAHARMYLPFEVADYVDFYASEQHATNCGTLLRPGQQPLTPNWKHLPVGYHGRAGTVVVSGTPVIRPHGQRKAPDEDTPDFGPSQRLDFETEVGFVVGTPSELGRPVPIDAFDQHVFGVCLVNDWSARDIQAWEAQPLGPHLAKSFSTSVSPWVVPLEALHAARVPPPPREFELRPYLRDGEPWGLDLALEVSLNGEVISRPPFAGMYWTGAQLLAHLTVNGASLRTGDLYASGTVSGTHPGEWGSLFELAWGGTRPLSLSDGSVRGFLADGDTVSITASAPGTAGARIGFGEVTGTVQPSSEHHETA